ncbi:hypothetical protein OESDEN_13989 [Oesophagostomum dentatum]|uniref:Sodium/calcium exchanger membrane region domain-containing protein n=1 Tax=Oesophagostomum dentatum TaxID=61180 RepID=A0A0B1SSU5_OESDE|nr:hypothetical protein OESDEN_13989 [Oesophagostomum dentatum]
MAFGNGAPDIFGSIASVLSSLKPKAGLALGELFGHLAPYAVYILTVVIAHQLHKQENATEQHQEQVEQYGF